MIDVADAIDDEAATVGYRAVTAAGGTWTDGGKWVPSVPVGATISAAIQPASGRALQDMPEGVRTEARFFGWSRSAVAEGDHVQFSGDWYRVIFLWPRAHDGGFYRFAMGKL